LINEETMKSANKEFTLTLFDIENKQRKILKIKKPSFPEAASVAYLEKENLTQKQKGVWKIISLVDNSTLCRLSIFTS
tara:strand:+ start:195 stop:428 length:234 start_codon:yes stop_codon:yes gene_type:complete